MAKSLKKSNINENNFSESTLSKTLYNIGATANIISILILLFHASYSVYNHISIHLSLLLFGIVKIVGLTIQLPYQWNKYEARRNIIIYIILYSIITALYFYGIFIMKL